MMQYDMALNCYENAAVHRPMYAEAYCNMGVIYKNRGDLDAAIACYERWCYIILSSVTFIFNLCTLYVPKHCTSIVEVWVLELD